MTNRARALHGDCEDTFVLPAAGFFADESAGRGHVQLPDGFRGIDIALQVQILRDWRAGIEAQLIGSLVHCFRSMFPDAETPLPERLAMFRAYCDARGIELPADFVLALQQH